MLAAGPTSDKHNEDWASVLAVQIRRYRRVRKYFMRPTSYGDYL
jgi:hypothetical protein